MLGIIRNVIGGTALVAGFSIGAYDRRNKTIFAYMEQPKDLKLNKEEIKKKIDELLKRAGKP